MDMNLDLTKRIKENPKYQELVSKREKFSWILSIVTLIIYYSFILLIAFFPEILGIQLYKVVTLGIPLGAFVIVISFVLTGIYTSRANNEFDRLIHELRDDLKITDADAYNHHDEGK